MEVKTYRLCSSDEMNIIKTFECGQCFRWNADENGVYRGITRGIPAKLYERDGNVYITTPGTEEFWRYYFDLDRDYASISQDFRGEEYMDHCVDYGMGIRILRQEPWEALCSYIISQCNNIKRIKGIVEKLCGTYGDTVMMDAEKYMTFPDAQKLSLLTPEDLAFLRSGYRAPYIINAANSVASGETDLQKLIDMPWREAKKELLKLNGIGEKVANCVVLFGLFHMEAFPIDTWIRKALQEHFSPDFDPESFGDYAGLAQQYIFFYARSTDNAS